MRALVELIDKQQILNLVSALNRKPDRVYFFYQEGQEGLLDNEVMRKYLECPYENVLYTPDNLEEKLAEIDADEIEVDVHGGNDFAIAVVSRMSGPARMALVYSGFTTKIMYRLEADDLIKEELYIPPLTVYEIVTLYGASVRKLKEPVFEGKDRDAVRACLWGRREHLDRWGDFCKKMASIAQKNEGQTVWTAPENVRGEYRSIFNMLGPVFKRCEVSDKCLYLELANPEYRILVTDGGVPFEYETYYQMEDSGYFDDIDVRVNIDWNGGEFEHNDPHSELDVIATMDGRLISVSCKAGKYDQQAIYEVKTNAVKFGGELAVPVLVTDYPVHHPEYIRKAEELGVLMIEYEDVRKERIADIIKNWMKDH
ncbi:MAG: DUF1887 family protein [Solobacterium sp.]|nr:DUF1887 family protein [Solobacterium sp.]